MKNYGCKKCGSIDVFIDDRGEQKALMCGDCGCWIKWLGKNEVPLVERFIKEEKLGQSPVKPLGHELSLRFEIEGLKHKVVSINNIDVSDKNIYL